MNLIQESQFQKLKRKIKKESQFLFHVTKYFLVKIIFLNLLVLMCMYVIYVCTCAHMCTYKCTPTRGSPPIILHLTFETGSLTDTGAY